MPFSRNIRCGFPSGLGAKISTSGTGVEIAQRKQVLADAELIAFTLSATLEGTRCRPNTTQVCARKGNIQGEEGGR